MTNSTDSTKDQDPNSATTPGFKASFPLISVEGRGRGFAHIAVLFCVIIVAIATAFTLSPSLQEKLNSIRKIIAGDITTLPPESTIPSTPVEESENEQTTEHPSKEPDNPPSEDAEPNQQQQSTAPTTVINNNNIIQIPQAPNQPPPTQPNQPQPQYALPSQQMLVKAPPADKGHSGCKPGNKTGLSDGDWYGFVKDPTPTSLNFDLTCHNVPNEKQFNDCGNLRQVTLIAADDISSFQRSDQIVGIRIRNGVVTHIWPEAPCLSGCAPNKPAC